jgi:hypothetical protein
MSALDDPIVALGTSIASELKGKEGTASLERVYSIHWVFGMALILKLRTVLAEQLLIRLLTSLPYIASPCGHALIWQKKGHSKRDSQ